MRYRIETWFLIYHTENHHNTSFTERETSSISPCRYLDIDKLKAPSNPSLPAISQDGRSNQSINQHITHEQIVRPSFNNYKQTVSQKLPKNYTGEVVQGPSATVRQTQSGTSFHLHDS